MRQKKLSKKHKNVQNFADWFAAWPHVWINYSRKSESVSFSHKFCSYFMGCGFAYWAKSWIQFWTNKMYITICPGSCFNLRSVFKTRLNAVCKCPAAGQGLKVAQNSFQHIPRLRFWCVIINNYNHGIKKLANHWWTCWYYFRDTIGWKNFLPFKNLTCCIFKVAACMRYIYSLWCHQELKLTWKYYFCFNRYGLKEFLVIHPAEDTEAVDSESKCHLLLSSISIAATNSKWYASSMYYFNQKDNFLKYPLSRIGNRLTLSLPRGLPLMSKIVWH